MKKYFLFFIFSLLFAIYPTLMAQSMLTGECGDKIYFSSGSTMKVKIMEISEASVKFLRCANITGPMITGELSKVSKIKYINGKVDLYKNGKVYSTIMEEPEKVGNGKKDSALVNNSVSGTKADSVSKTIPNNAASSVGCDTIYLTNGTIQIAKVLEVVFEDIAYKKCESLEGPTRRIDKTYVKSIVYANGDVDSFSPALLTPSSKGDSKNGKKNGNERSDGEKVLIGCGIAAGTCLAGGAVLWAVACNCPHVSVIGEDKVQFQGSLFPGAISKSLERSDYLIMKDIPLTKEGGIKVKIYNELEEEEYINKIELLEVTKMKYSTLGVDQKGELISFNTNHKFITAIDQNNVSVSRKLSEQDRNCYDFTAPAINEELSSVNLVFNRSALKNEAVLVIKAKNSNWLETVAEVSFQQLGDKFDLWSKKLDKADPIKYKKAAIKKGMSMNAYVKIDNGWIYAGSFENAGTLEERFLTLKMDISSIKGDNLEIKLECAFGFWDLDFVCISDQWSEDVEYVSVNRLSAINYNEQCIMQELDSTDARYAELPKKGNYFDLEFAAPINKKAIFVLKGIGYYRHYRTYTNRANYKFIKVMRKDPLSYHKLSNALYNYQIEGLNKSSLTNK